MHRHFELFTKYARFGPLSSFTLHHRVARNTMIFFFWYITWHWKPVVKVLGRLLLSMFCHVNFCTSQYHIDLTHETLFTTTVANVDQIKIRLHKLCSLIFNLHCPFTRIILNKNNLIFGNYLGCLLDLFGNVTLFHTIFNDPDR